MQLHPAPGVADVSLKDCILVAPAVAFANIGELAVDVLVCTLQAELMARLDSPNLLACVGNNAYQAQPAGLLATAAELYRVPGTQVVLLQQRAPAIPGRQQAFAAELAAWAAGAGLSHLLLLCGLDARYRREQQLEGSQLRYLPGSSTNSSGGGAGSGADVAAPPTGQLQQLRLHAGALGASCSAAGLALLEPEVVANERELHGLLPPWPLLDACAEAKVAATLLATFAAEGDNAQDGMQLATKALAVLQVQGLLMPVQTTQQQQQQQAVAEVAADEVPCLPALQVPCSWVGLFGRTTIDSQLF